MNRRDFLRLLAIALGSAGVTASTIGSVFANEPKADKMSVAEAIRRLAERFNAAKKGRSAIALDALKVMSEAHRDYTLAWAGGAVTYFCRLCKGDGLLNLVRNARDHREDPLIRPFLEALKTTLLTGNRGAASLFIHEANMAYCEMAGKPVSDAYNELKHSRYLHDLLQYHPDIYARDFAGLE
jgi:hypothetical protein